MPSRACCIGWNRIRRHKAQDGLRKNDHFRQVLDTARERGFSSSRVVFDSWYASLENLKKVRTLGWQWLT